MRTWQGSFFKGETCLKNRQNRQKKAQPLPVLFICISVLPAVILTLMFTIWPTVQALYLSFTNATSLGLNNKFVWLDNYIYMFHDKSFIQALKKHSKADGGCSRYHNFL